MSNQECISIFEAYLRNDKKASENTLSSYLRDVRQFGEYLRKGLRLAWMQRRQIAARCA